VFACYFPFDQSIDLDPEFNQKLLLENSCRDARSNRRKILLTRSRAIRT
jgi:hypothetical protein